MGVYESTITAGRNIKPGAAFSDWFIKCIWWIIFTMGGILFALEIDELIVRGLKQG